MCCPSAKKSHETTEGMPRLAKAPRMTPQGKASNRIAATRLASVAAGKRVSQTEFQVFQNKDAPVIGLQFVNLFGKYFHPNFLAEELDGFELLGGRAGGGFLVGRGVAGVPRFGLSASRSVKR